LNDFEKRKTSTVSISKAVFCPFEGPLPGFRFFADSVP